MIAIVGAGAMGGMLAARLSSAGYDVTLIDVNEKLVEKVKKDGLIVETKGSTETVNIAITSKPQEIGKAEMIFFFVKAQHTDSAAKMVRPIVDKTTRIISLQNGWGNADVLAQTYPQEQLVVGVTYNSATVLELGKVAHTGKGITYLGPYVDGADLDGAEQVGVMLAKADMENKVTAEVKTEIWKKLILNAATLPTSALTGLNAGNVGKPGPLLQLVDALAEEAVLVANHQGYKIILDERIEQIHAVLERAGSGKASMLQDTEGKRKTEIEVINAAVVNAAKQTGDSVPLNQAMVALISGLERSWLK